MIASPESISSRSPASPEIISVEALRQLVDPENGVTQPTPKSAEKTKKKKKKKEREKDRSSRRQDREEKHPRKSRKKSDKKRKYSSSESSESSRSRSRSRHGSGKKNLRDRRKLESSTSRMKKDFQRRSHPSTSHSRSSSSDRSQTLTSRSRSHQQSRRKGSKKVKNHTGRQSTSYSRSSSSDSYQSSRRRSRSRSRSKNRQRYKNDKPSSSGRSMQFARCRSRSVKRSRSCSPHSDSESSSYSVSPKRSRQRSESSSRDLRRIKKHYERSHDKLSRKETKAPARSRSSSLSPRSRHRTLSGDCKESRSSRVDSIKRLGPQSLTKKSISKSVEDGSKQSSRTERRHKHPMEEIYQSKQKTMVQPSGKSPARKREHDVQNASDVVEIPSKNRGKRERGELDKERSRQLKPETRARRNSQEEISMTRRPSHSDTDSRGDESSEEQNKKQLKRSDSYRSSNSVLGKDKDIRSKKSQQSSKASKTHGTRGDDRKHPGRKDLYRSRSRSYSSEGSYSDTSYSSYSLSGSRSYSYSSYSSSGSYSDSDDSYYRQKDSAHKVKQTKGRSKQSTKASPGAHGKTRTSKVRKDKQRDEGENDEDDDSDSDVDTGIYEISRDHLEMYMDSKSYQLKKVNDESPLKKKKRWRSEEEEEVMSDKKGRFGKRKDTSDDDKEKKISLVPVTSAYKESQRTAKQGSKSRTKFDPALVAASQDVGPPKDEMLLTASIPFPPVLQVRHPDTVRSVGPEETSFPLAYTRSSDLDATFKQSLEPHTGHHMLVVPDKSSLLSIVPDVGPHQSIGHYIHDGPSQSILEDRAPDGTINTEIDHQQQLLMPGHHQYSMPEAKNRKRESGGHKSELSQREMFTSEQLSVIESISKQLTQTCPNALRVTASRKNFDTEAAQPDQRLGDHIAKGQGSSEVINPVQGHNIGVVMTQRSSDTFVQSDNYQGIIPPQIMERTNRFGDHSVRTRRRRWDVKMPDTGKDRASEPERVVGSFPLGDGNPLPVSIDYKHGQNTSSNIKPDSSRGAAYDQPERSLLKTHGLQHPGMLDPHQGHHGRDAERANVTEVEKQMEEPHNYRGRESEDLSRHRGHHRSKGENLHDERSRGERSEGRTYYYSTRHGRTEVESRNIDPSQSVSSVQVVDYQHGKSNRHDERSRTTSDKSLDERYESRYHDRHHGDYHRSSFERHHGHSEARGSSKYGSGDKRHYHDRHRHRDTQRDRYHARSSSTHGGRAQRCGTPVEPKESNPFLQLVSSSKDMQVASLHSEGKWGHSPSPEGIKSPSRSWWL